MEWEGSGGGGGGWGESKTILRREKKNSKQEVKLHCERKKRNSKHQEETEVQSFQRYQTENNTRRKIKKRTWREKENCADKRKVQELAPRRSEV